MNLDNPPHGVGEALANPSPQGEELDSLILSLGLLYTHKSLSLPLGRLQPPKSPILGNFDKESSLEFKALDTVQSPPILGDLGGEESRQ